MLSAVQKAHLNTQISLQREDQLPGWPFPPLVTSHFSIFCDLHILMYNFRLKLFHLNFKTVKLSSTMDWNMIFSNVSPNETVNPLWDVFVSTHKKPSGSISSTSVMRVIHKFPHWVDKINNNNHLGSNTKGYGSKTH